MKLEDVSATEHAALEVAVHESAHATFAVYLGASVAEAVIDRDTAEGLCTLTASVSPEVERGIGYAGVWAQVRWRHGGRPALSNIIEGLRENRHDWDRVVRADAGLPRQIEPVLETLWPAITQVAKTLFITGRADHDAVCAALGMTGDQRHDDAVRASVRMGDAPRTFSWTSPPSEAAPRWA